MKEAVEPIINTEGLNVFYGEQHVLKDVTVGIPEKRITAIIGPSGCGKSTFLKSLNRLIELTDGVKVSGKIYFHGLDVFDGKIDVMYIRKKMGFLAQKPCPLPMSIYDNVTYGPRIHGLDDKKELAGIVESCLQSASLWDEVKDRLKTPASRLSVGQQQRLCLARALAVEPEVLLCDEPTSALDPISAQRIEELLINLKKNYTVVIVTHVLRQAMRLADHVVFLYLGKLIEHGSAEKVFRNPENTVTQAYVKGVFS